MYCKLIVVLYLKSNIAIGNTTGNAQLGIEYFWISHCGVGKNRSNQASIADLIYSSTVCNQTRS